MLAAITILGCKETKDTVYTVTFDSDGGAAVVKQTVVAGETATAPATNPTKTGYVFMYWSLNGANTAYNFQTPVNGDITLIAKWQEEAKVEYWQVTWNLNGGSWAAGYTPPAQVVKGGTLSEPTAPVKSGSTFDGWYREAAFTNKVNFPYSVSGVTANFTLYAKWETADVSSRSQGLYIGNSTTAVNLNAYSGNIIARAAQYINANAPADYTIVLEQDVARDDNTGFGKNDCTITIIGKGGMRTITRPGNPNALLFSGGTLIIGENITVAGFRVLGSSSVVIMKSGSSMKSNDRRSAVEVAAGKFIMEGGSIASNISTSSYFSGGGVTVEIGEFIMEGGSISGCVSSTFGGGVFIRGDGSFTMKGGTISGNYAGLGGGVCIWGNGKFFMEGGVIQNNRALNGTALGVAVSGGGQGGGVYLGNNVGSTDNGEFVMSGGTIYGTNDVSLGNSAQNGGAALYLNAGTARYGNGVSIGTGPTPRTVNSSIIGVK